MFKSSITIKGGAFTEPTRLENILAKRMNIVYGRNGSGKSTIARAFREQQADYQQNHPGRAFELSFDGKGDSLPSEVQNRLFVFNEDFVDENVKFSKSGLKSIVRIGASAELEGPIEESKNQINDLQKKLKPLKEEYDVLCGTGEGSISTSEKRFKDDLKAKGGFLDRLNQIEGRQHNLTSSLLTSVQNALIEEDNACSLAEEAKNLSLEIERYLSYQEGSPIHWQAPSLAVLPDIDSINNILGQVVRPAELSDQERVILDDLSNALAAESFISKTQALIINNDRNYCPLCHQTVSPDHKHLLEKRIVRFRDKQVEEFKNKVELALDGIAPIQDSIPSIPGVDSTNEQTSIANLNKFISDIYQALKRKKDNPFSAIPTFDKSKWEPICTACQKAFIKIAEDVGAYNTKLEEKETLLSDIKQKNISLAARENRDMIKDLKKKNERKSSLESEIRSIDVSLKELQQKLKSLQGQLDQIDDAREQINKYLDIIFGERKLQLSNDTKETYKLQLRKSKDHYIDIPPRFVSSGERNALALAYFFACVLEKKDKDYDYGEPTLLVIDDPVSSFDAENKAGVISLLSLQCEKIISGNPDSKLLVFTHDQTTLRTLCENRLQFFPKEKEQTDSFLRLTQSHKLKKCMCSNIRGNMEYFSDLMAIFKFATCDDPEEFENIGNTIRSFAEYFASYMYKCSWLDLFSDNKRLECLPRDIREKIKAFAIRSVLNSESHSVFSDFEPAEIQRAAKMLLVFMFYSNYDHLYAYLVRRNNEAEDRKKMEMIESWGWEF